MDTKIRNNVILTIRGGSASWKTYNRGSSRHVPIFAPGGFGTVPNPDSVERRRRKRISRFAHVLAALSKDPKWHIVLNCDKKAQRVWDIEKALEVFKKFSKWLQKNFPKAWFIWIMEFTPKAGPHFHMLGAFRTKNGSRKAVIKKWQNLTKSNWEEATVIDPFRKEHIGYLTKPGKAKGTSYLIRRLGGKGFWGCINRRNMSLYEKETYNLPIAQFQIFRSVLKTLLIEHGAAQSSIDRLDKGCNGLRFCTHVMLQKALEAALNSPK